MDFTNVRTESQSCPLAVGGRAAAGLPGSHWEEPHSARRHAPPWPPDHRLGGAVAGMQGSQQPLARSGNVPMILAPCSYPDKGANSQLMGIPKLVLFRN